MLSRVSNMLKTQLRPHPVLKRTVTTTPTGALLPAPEQTSFGLIKVCLAVIPGLLIGATISKYMANFLEENELFVPSDDDDDDD
ncbi:essential MCU regulator, mitochondrial [Planococcus citri]|uniref:essential MCU regulator, mitochondrial n=1 Tax=Planococcus citri TaxID=170843 RepID=UPI0031F97F97